MMSYKSAMTGAQRNPTDSSATKLNGHNYLEWAQFVKLAIDGRGKIGHLTGEISKPDAGDPSQKNGSPKILLLLLGSSIQ